MFHKHEHKEPAVSKTDQTDIREYITTLGDFTAALERVNERMTKVLRKLGKPGCYETAK